jgi:hypothetical protein
LSASSSSTLSRVEQLDLNREKRENKKRKSFGIIRKIQLFGWQQQHTHTHTAVHLIIPAPIFGRAGRVAQLGEKLVSCNQDEPGKWKIK